MKKKQGITMLGSILAVGAVVGGAVLLFSDSAPEPQPAVEYRAVCRNLPENAHRTSNNSTRKEIPQQQTSPNVREPNPVGTFSGAIDDKQCYFICNGNFIRDGGVCRGITHDVNAGTITVTDGVNTYTIMDKNLGATVAGTGSNSYGHHFQRGNNFGFANTGILSPVSTGLVTTVGNITPSSYSNGTYIYGSGDRANPANSNLRGGSSSDGTGTIPTNYDERRGPCLSGYHVPSQGEWNQLLIVRANNNSISLSDSNGYKYFSGDTARVQKFANDFLLPPVGTRDSASIVYNQGSAGYYWSSSPYSAVTTRNFSFVSYGIYVSGNNPRARGFSVRCFKN